MEKRLFLNGTALKLFRMQNFNLWANQGAEITDVVSALHPTPAVCGMPKTESLHFIGENEGYSRGFYSGVVGMLAPNDKTDLYVNLRCANIKGQIE